MRFERSGRSIDRLWILCTICALLLGICFDSVRADSSLAYRDFAEAAEGTAASGVFGADTTLEGTVPGVFHAGMAPSALCAPQKGIPAQQAYVSEGAAQGNSAIMPRRTAQRTSSRSICRGFYGALSAEIFSFELFSGRMPLFADGLCEIISNTVILQYIHWQDGEKAIFVLHS